MNAAKTKIYKNAVNPSDAQVEQWEREYETSDDSGTIDYERAILERQEEDPGWWG